jgi:hypothetical protein
LKPTTQATPANLAVQWNHSATTRQSVQSQLPTSSQAHVVELSDQSLQREQQHWETTRRLTHFARRSALRLESAVAIEPVDLHHAQATWLDDERQRLQRQTSFDHKAQTMSSVSDPVCIAPVAPKGVSEQPDSQQQSSSSPVSSPALDAAMQFRNEVLANLKKELATAPAVSLADDGRADAAAQCSALAVRLSDLLAQARARNASAPVDKLDATLDAVAALIERLRAEAPFATRSPAFDSFSQEVGIATSAIFRAQGKLMDQIKAIKKALLA